MGIVCAYERQEFPESDFEPYGYAGLRQHKGRGHLENGLVIYEPRTTGGSGGGDDPYGDGPRRFNWESKPSRDFDR
jgi:hypothetical protein